MPGCETGIGGYAQDGENSSLNCSRDLIAGFAFQLPRLRPAAAHWHRDYCLNNWSTRKRFRKRTFDTCWGFSSILFFVETEFNPGRLGRICNDIVISGIKLLCTTMKGKIL